MEQTIVPQGLHPHFQKSLDEVKKESMLRTLKLVQSSFPIKVPEGVEKELDTGHNEEPGHETSHNLRLRPVLDFYRFPPYSEVAFVANGGQPAFDIGTGHSSRFYWRTYMGNVNGVINSSLAGGKTADTIYPMD